MTRGLCFALLAALAGCATEPGPAPPRPTGVTSLAAGAPPREAPTPSGFAAAAGAEVELPLPSPGGEGDAPLFTVDGHVLRKSDLGDFVLRYLTDRARAALSDLLDEAVIRAEAARESVSLPDALVLERCERHMEERRAEVRREHGAAADFDAVVRRTFGRDVAEFRKDAERLVRSVLLLDRLVRLDEFREDAAEVRVLVLGAREAAVAAAASLRSGADITLLAERAGARRPAAPPPVLRGETGDALLEARLFAAAPGEVLDPVSFEAPSGATFWQVFKVVRTWRASDAPYAALAARIESSLAGSPVTPEESARWRRRAYSRHEVLAAGTDKRSVPGPGGE